MIGMNFSGLVQQRPMELRGEWSTGERVRGNFFLGANLEGTAMPTANFMLIPTAITVNRRQHIWQGVVISASPEFEDAPIWQSQVGRATRLEAIADAETAVEMLRVEATRQLRLL